MKENTNSQAIYDFLMKCEKRNPFGFIFDERLSVYDCSDKGVRLHNEISGSLITYSYHDLFSKDSGIMEFVRRPSEGKMIMIDAEIIEDGEGLPGVDAKDSADDCEPKYRYMEMGPMTEQEKITYFVNNAIIPTKQLNICIECGGEVAEREPVTNCCGVCRLEI